MKSAFECFQHAAQCEDMARITSDSVDRTMLLDTARHWRALAENTRLFDRCEIIARPPKVRVTDFA